MELSPAQWRGVLGLTEDEVPAAVITEGTWWRERQTALRLADLADVRPLGVPDVWWGRTAAGTPVAYSCAYGAARAVEPVHMLGVAGARLAIQIGSCGALQPGLEAGDVVVPELAVIGEGASQWYGGRGRVAPDPGLVEAAERRLRARGATVRRGLHLTTSALLAQPRERVAAWHAAGYRSVDMEASAVCSAARHLGLRPVALLYVWDDLLAGRTWLDALPPEVEARRLAGDAALWAVALELADDAATVA
jgi:uridine phosphorylase